MVHLSRAEAAPDGRHLLESTAALVARIDPVELERAAVLARDMGGEPAMAANLASLGSAGAAGFDTMAVAGWRSIGADPDQPVWLQLDRSTDGSSELVHLRALARIADGARAAAWARGLPLLERPWAGDVAGAAKSALADHLGGVAPRELDAAARALASRGTLVVGRLRGTGTVVLIRRVGAYLVVDALWTAREEKLRWTDDRAAVLGRLDAPSAGAGVDLASAGGAGARLLDRPGIALWSRPGGPVDLARALLGAPRECDDPRLRASGALTDVAVSLRTASNRVQIDLAWGVAEGSAVATALAPREDGLFAPRRQAGAVLAAGIYLAGVARLRALPRGASIGGGWSPLWRRARPCGTIVRTDLALFSWPELAGQWLDETAALSPDATALVGSARNFSFGARRVSLRDRREWVAAAEASLDGVGRPVAESILGAVFGGRTATRRPRAHVAWDGNYMRPYLLPGSARRPDVIGVGLGTGAVAWRLRHPGAAPRRASGAVIARASGDVGALLRQIAPGLGAPWDAVATAAAARVGSFQASVTTERSAVRASLTIRRR